MAVYQAGSYGFDGTLADHFSVYSDSPDPSVVAQASGVLGYYTQGQPIGEVGAEEVLLAKDVASGYDQSWAAEVDVTVPGTLADTAKNYDAYLEGGLVVQFTATDGTRYSFFAGLGLGDVTQNSRRFNSEYAITPPGGEWTEYLDGQGERATADVAGRVGIRFNAETKVLTAYSQSQVLLSIDLDGQGITNWHMSGSDAFAVYLLFDTAGWSVAADKKLTMDNFTFAVQGVPLNGSEVAETLEGTVLGDHIHALGGDDTLYGLAGDDWLDGGQGDDLLVGGDGDDVLLAAYGQDSLVGGAGKDIFGFYTAGDFVIDDFSLADDALYFSTADTGLRNIADLLAAITSVEQAQDRVIIHFGEIASIALVGVTAAQLDPGMAHFV